MSELRISTDKAELDFAVIYGFLSTEAYWARNIPRETVTRAIENSLCFGGYVDGAQVAFARVVSDFATFAYLADVFVLPGFRGNGYSKRIVEAVLAHGSLQGLRRFMLATSDAHALYAQYGFTAPARPQVLMEVWKPDIYAKAGTA